MEASILTPAGSVVAAASQPQTAAAPDAAENYNMIAVPLDASAQVNPFTASGLGTFLGPAVKQVSKLDPNAQGYLTWYPEIQDGDEFDLTVGGAYMILLGIGANSVVSFVGDVPDAGDVQFTLVRPAGAGCLYNDISLPLDQSAITTPQALGDAIGNVEQVSQFDANNQGFLTWYPQIGDGDDFAVKIRVPLPCVPEHGWFDNVAVTVGAPPSFSILDYS